MSFRSFLVFFLFFFFCGLFGCIAILAAKPILAPLQIAFWQMSQGQGRFTRLLQFVLKSVQTFFVTCFCFDQTFCACVCTFFCFLDKIIIY